ncbi:MAG: LysR family transcriptional regulator [Halioglobus sp.]
MDTQNLRAFILVAEGGSFSEAADKLHLTQPAVSKRIAQLEEQLDTPLFDRIGRTVSLTEAGKALLPHARTVELELAAAERSVRDLDGEVAGKLRLATSHHIGLHRLPPVLSQFTQQFDAVQVDIDFMDSEQAYELTLRGEVELSIVTLAPTEQPHLVTRTIWNDPLDFMVQSGHPLTERKTLDLKTLSKHPAILPGLNTYTGQIVESLFEQRGLPLNVSLATNYLETIRMMASIGLGWTVLPRTMRDNTLVSLPLRDGRLQRSLGVVYHEGRSLSRAAQAFISVLEALK